MDDSTWDRDVGLIVQHYGHEVADVPPGMLASWRAAVQALTTPQWQEVLRAHWHAPPRFLREVDGHYWSGLARQVRQARPTVEVPCDLCSGYGWVVVLAPELRLSSRPGHMGIDWSGLGDATRGVALYEWAVGCRCENAPAWAPKPPLHNARAVYDWVAACYAGRIDGHQLQMDSWRNRPPSRWGGAKAEAVKVAEVPALPAAPVVGEEPVPF